MQLKTVLRRNDFSINEAEFTRLKQEARVFIGLLEKSISKNRINADVFLGGSFAKNTLAKSEGYDADIFVRFGWEYEDLSALLEKVLKGVAAETRLKMKKIHGSRDYFRVYKNEKLTFEVIPVLKIKNVREARNVTDLSYFHVGYVRKHLTGNLKRELALTKKFFRANDVYGAESYIHGFSGYGLECLIIYYKSLEKLLKNLVRVKENARIIIDPAKHYKKSDDVFFGLNESKLHSPIILVDPTWKERNVLASLSKETFEKFQETARNFIKNPSEDLFYKKQIDKSALEKHAKKNGAEFLNIILETDRQEGDIAGTKMKKFSTFLADETDKYFELVKKEFFYSGEGSKAEIYLILKSRKEVIKVGPPLKRKKDVARFKKTNKKTFVKNGLLHARIKVDFSAREFLERFIQKERNRKMHEMGIIEMKVF